MIKNFWPLLNNVVTLRDKTRDFIDSGRSPNES